jgi:hypothetical protein
MPKNLLPCLFSLLILSPAFSGCGGPGKEIERPEKIVSKRDVVYDREAYVRLAGMWKTYYEAYPSEDAYANWMYALRYSESPEYEAKLRKGLSEYPANPTLEYLTGLLRHGASDDDEGLRHLERAVELDPTFTDAWFGLVTDYMGRNEPVRVLDALKHLLETGAIRDEVMDYSYNMIALMGNNSVLVTNGDNDTYPGWILTKVLDYRPDVTIVNRSLLNTDWYPGYVQDEGAPKFITTGELGNLREYFLGEMQAGRFTPGAGGPFSDSLITRLVEAASREGRKVFFAATLFSTPAVVRYRDGGINLGIVTLVTPLPADRTPVIREACEVWTTGFRTSGVDSWSLAHSGPAAAGRQLALNYSAGLYNMMEGVVESAPGYRLPLFRWYLAHALGITPEKYRSELKKMWCAQNDIAEISRWCATAP